MTATDRDSIAELDAALVDTPCFFVDSLEVSEEIGEAWFAAHAPCAINPRGRR